MWSVLVNMYAVYAYVEYSQNFYIKNPKLAFTKLNKKLTKIPFFHKNRPQKFKPGSTPAIVLFVLFIKFLTFLQYGSDVLIVEASDSETNEVTSDKDVGRFAGKNADYPECDDNEQEVTVGPVLSLKCLHDESDDEVLNSKPQDEEHTYLVPVQLIAVKDLPAVTDSTVFKPESSVPVRNNWEGAHNFQIKIPCTDIRQRSDTYFFSEAHNKLYISKDFPFKIIVFANNVPAGSMIKVTAAFSMLEHFTGVVHRCPSHAQQDFATGKGAYEHFVQSFSKTAVYKRNRDTGELSVSVPYEEPEEGETYTSYLFKLTCYSSCTGGINRRPFVLMFTLEKDNIPLGRKVIEAKVCACPLRDFKLDEERGHIKKPRTIKPKTEIKETSLSSSEENTNGNYTISVKDPELFQFLKQMKYLYETRTFPSKFKPDS